MSNKPETMPNKLPLKGDSICYKNTDSQWINAVILGRAGKSTGKYKHWYNDLIMIYLNPVLILMQSTGNYYLQIQQNSQMPSI